MKAHFYTQENGLRSWPPWCQCYLSRKVQSLALLVLNQERTSPPIGRPHPKNKGKSPLSFIVWHSIICQWFNSLFLGIDANFMLKCKNVSKESSDPSLSKGWSYFIKERNYKQHLSKHIDQPIKVSLLHILFEYRKLGNVLSEGKSLGYLCGGEPSNCLVFCIFLNEWLFEFSAEVGKGPKVWGPSC